MGQTAMYFEYEAKHGEVVKIGAKEYTVQKDAQYTLTVPYGFSVFIKANKDAEAVEHKFEDLPKMWRRYNRKDRRAAQKAQRKGR